MIVRTMKKVFLFFLWIIFPALIFGQEIKVNTSIDTNNVFIGEPINVKLFVSITKDYHVVFPQITDTVGRLEVISKSEIDTIIQKDDIQLTQNIKVTSFEAGSYQIPELTFIYEKAKSGNLLAANSIPLYVNFKTVEIDTASGLRDIKAPIEFPLSLFEILFYFSIAYLAAGLISLIITLIKNRKVKPKKQVIRYDAKIPADLEALEAFIVLEKDKLWQNSRYKEYYSRMTDILRTYIHRRFDINSFEMTSDEILNALQNKDVSENAFNILKDILGLADLAKFAKYEPYADDNIKSLENSRFFVNNTKQLFISDEESKISEVTK